MKNNLKVLFLLVFLVIILLLPLLSFFRGKMSKDVVSEQPEHEDYTILGPFEQPLINKVIGTLSFCGIVCCSVALILFNRRTF